MSETRKQHAVNRLTELRAWREAYAVSALDKADMLSKLDEIITKLDQAVDEALVPEQASALVFDEEGFQIWLPKPPANTEGMSFAPTSAVVCTAIAQYFAHNENLVLDWFESRNPGIGQRTVQPKH